MKLLFIYGSPAFGKYTVANEVIKIFYNDCPLKFYSRKLLFSVEARSEFVDPDLKID